MLKPLLAALSFLPLAFSSGIAAAVIINWENSAGTELYEADGITRLTAGSSLSGDGAELQLGYYNLATDQTPFAGIWVPLTGEGSANSFITSVGDFSSLPAGRFDIKTTFTLGSPTTGNNFPAAGTPLAIRFYDSTSVVGSQFFNAVSNTQGLWDWLAPSDPAATRNVALTDAGVVWQGGSSSAFRTSLPVPEPTTGSLLLLAFALGDSVRRRVRNRHGPNI